MGWFLICTRLLLGAVFLVAAVGKLLDRERTAASLAHFGLPAPLIGAGTIALIGAELLVAAALLFAATAQAGAICAAVLLATFTSATALALRRGDDFDCECFGALHSERIGAPMTVRNATLAIIAVGVATQPVQPAVDAWFAQRSASDLVMLGISVALAATGLAGTHWRKNRVPRVAAGAPSPAKPAPVGRRAPAFRLEDVTGRWITLKSLLRAQRPIALLFLSPDCGPCQAALSDVSRWQVSLARDLPIHVVSSGGHEQTRAMAREHHLDHVLIDSGRAVATRYGISGTPTALIVDPDARVATAPAGGPAAIEAVIRRALAP